jgi:hypothetical protein
MIINPFIFGASTDPDADAFILATGITDTTQMSAINTLVVDLKSYSLWTKLNTIYPFIGGTSTTHKYNLKNPLDTDIANRIVWSGGVTHDANGVTGNGINAYGNTFLDDSTLTLTDKHISMYQRNILPHVSGTSFGGDNNSNRFFLNYSNSNYSTLGRTQTAFAVVSPQNGTFIMSKIITGEFKYYQNSLSATTLTGADVSGGSYNYHLLAGNNNGSGFEFSNANLSFASLGEGLSATEVTDLRTTIETFQTTLSRNV